MVESVKRGYHSDLRAAQARQTRRSIVSAAGRLFIENGYGATTIDAIAEAAGVSRKTVFAAVGGKVELLKVALDWAVAGDDEAVALADRSDLRRLLEDPNPEALVGGWARMQAEIDTRVAPLYRALEVAASSDTAARDLLEQSQRQRLEGARRVVQRLVALDALTAGRSRGEAADLAWLASDPTLFDRLVRVRGWSASRFAEWLAQTLIDQLVTR